MSDRAYELTHTDGKMNPAPDWAHRLLDLAWGGWSIMPTGGVHMAQQPVPGALYTAWTEYGNETFSVDFRDNKEGKWTVTVNQPQPEPVPAEHLSADEWLARKAKGEA